MQHFAKIFGTSLITLALLFAQIPFLAAPTAHAAVSNWWLKGATMIPSYNTEFSSANFQQSVRDFKAIGGTYINLVIPYYQSNVFSSDIGPGNNTPTDDSLISAIQYAHSQGLHVELSIYLESRGGEWRALIAASDRNAWYSAYDSVLQHYAKLAQSQGVELYQLGAELISMASASMNADNTQRWQTMISNVRQAYSGKLTYSANRGQNNWSSEVPNIGFWGSLDYVGISAYYDTSGDGSVASLVSQWAGPDSYDITPIYQKTGKPVIFTEIGYKSVTGAHFSPWDSGKTGPYDPQEQVNDYEALFEYWNASGKEYVQGMTLWWWSPDPNYGGAGNIDYTPQHKPAADTISKWWTTNVSPPAPPSGFQASGTATPAAPSSAGQPVNLSASVTGTGSDVIVDLEVYNGSSKVFQQFYEHQDFSGGQTRQYQTSWTPSGTGTYTFKIGVFASGWSQLASWNDSAATVSVGTGGGTTPPPPSGGTIDFWWPVNDVHISGLTPFKGLLEGTDVSQYQMFWQVDGGGLVPMDTNTTDWPHKEALVDLSGWNWRDGGPYTITFVAKDNNGTTIAQNSIQIWIP